ncbi:nickel-type superoxide dismutase maturation protease [Moritella sp. 24]|uniref:nickel-type superoxide dismutase maturation protease n=1 Tax=Moritella sp. 24 TaxID=2746230 RepID=UPI001BA7B3D6|nr:nickel-type superoxide dismutase maturation protease [Moritella sp. 24]QUM76018.1 nickel-type superoxide dismutase maturation protease [Moritella sp. 24]
MSPCIPEGSYVLVNGWLSLLSVKPEQIIKVRHTRYGDIIKTLDHIDEQGFLWLRGEHESSVSMLEMGPVSQYQLIGVVWFIIKPRIRNN